MKIVIPGGSGQIGHLLARYFAGAGHEVVLLSRSVPKRSPWRVVQWDGRSPGTWSGEIDGSDVVINLAGRSVNCRYTKKNLNEILQSRVHSTAAVGKAISQATHPPCVWLQASTATIYRHTFGEANDEFTGVLGGDEPDVPGYWKFSVDVARAWEAAATAVPLKSTRLVLLRSALTLTEDRGGIFDVLMGLTRKGLGGTNASGRQYVSWIHGDDFVSAVQWLIDHDELSGVFNLASPHPMPNAEFMRTLRCAAGVPIGLPATKWMLELGAILMRTDTELLLKSRRVVPRRLPEAGFVFRFADWGTAAADLCRRWRSAGLQHDR